MSYREKIAEQRLQIKAQCDLLVRIRTWASHQSYCKYPRNFDRLVPCDCGLDPILADIEVFLEEEPI